MIFAAIDPGPERSAVVSFGSTIGSDRPTAHGILDNDQVLELILKSGYPQLAIEMIASYGMPVGKTVFDTCVWIGRFGQQQILAGGEFHRVYRKDVKMHLCQHPRAKDSNIRQALLDRYGGKEKALGRKASPGPLYGFKADLWAALAVGLTWRDTQLPLLPQAQGVVPAHPQ